MNVNIRIVVYRVADVEMAIVIDFQTKGCSCHNIVRHGLRTVEVDAVESGAAQDMASTLVVAHDEEFGRYRTRYCSSLSVSSCIGRCQRQIATGLVPCQIEFIR